MLLLVPRLRSRTKGIQSIWIRCTRERMTTRFHGLTFSAIPAGLLAAPGDRKARRRRARSDRHRAGKDRRHRDRVRRDRDHARATRTDGRGVGDRHVRQRAAARVAERRAARRAGAPRARRPARGDPAQPRPDRRQPAVPLARLGRATRTSRRRPSSRPGTGSTTTAGCSQPRPTTCRTTGGMLIQFDGEVFEAERSELPWLRSRLESMVAAAA